MLRSGTNLQPAACPLFPSGQPRFHSRPRNFCATDGNFGAGIRLQIITTKKEPAPEGTGFFDCRLNIVQIYTLPFSSTL
jgi:hypothetical protein